MGYTAVAACCTVHLERSTQLTTSSLWCERISRSMVFSGALRMNEATEPRLKSLRGTYLHISFECRKIPAIVQFVTFLALNILFMSSVGWLITKLKLNHNSTYEYVEVCGYISAVVQQRLLKNWPGAQI